MPFMPSEKGFSYAINHEDATYNITGISYLVFKDEPDICIPSEINGRTVTGIAENAFLDCSWITSITIPYTVTNIGYYAFRGCTKLNRINIPSSITVIGEGAFSECKKISEVYITDLDAWRKIKFCNYFSNPLHKGAYLELNGEFVTELVIPEGDTSTGAFQGCCSLTSVTIPDSFTCIEDSAFSGCENLESITIGKGVTRIGRSAFFGCKKLTNLTIPDSVTSIGDRAFYRCSALTSVNVGKGLRSVGEYAFVDCKSLKEVHITDLAAWCSASFSTEANPLYYAKNLYLNGELVTELVVPDGVTKIGNHAFDQYKCITSVIIPNSVTSIGTHAFQGCSALTNVTISEGVTSIGEAAFYGCAALTNVTILAKGISIAKDAFEGCKKHIIHKQKVKSPSKEQNPSSEKTVNNRTVQAKKNRKTKPYDIKKIGLICAIIALVAVIALLFVFMLKHKHTFTSEIIPPLCEEEGYTKHVCECGEEYIDTYVSAKGHSLENGFCKNCDYSVFQYTLSPAGDSYIFEHGAGGNVVILSEYNGLPVTSIGDSAFENCTGLLSVTIPDSITSIGNSAFLGCTSLTSVTIPDSVTSIGREVFSGCDAISEITLPFVGTTEDGSQTTQLACIFGSVSWAQDNSSVPSSLKKVIITSGAEIGDYAFYGCSSIESITIPESVTSIGYQAFAECTGLTEINFNATDCSLSYPVYFYNAPFMNSGKSGTGIVLNIGDNVKHIPNRLFNASNVSSIKIGKSITSIGDYAFSRCESLTEVTIPGNVLNIGNYAFEACYNLCELTIEEGVKSIGNYAFEYCNELTEIVIPNSIENIGHATFYECDSLRYNSEGDLNYLGNNTNKYLFLINVPIGIRTATINENCKIISSSAFYDCSLLTSVTIPEGVTSIGDYAFSGCSSLESITLPDSVKNIGTTAFRDCRSLTSIVIPDSVTSMGYDAFYWCTLTIYCEASQKPDGWDSDWNCDYDNSINNGEKSYLTVFWKGQWQYDENGIPVPLS